MSKKHKKQSGSIASAASGAGALTEHAGEYAAIRHDLWKVLYLNLIYLAAVLALYFSDQKSQYLERWLGKLLHF